MKICPICKKQLAILKVNNGIDMPFNPYQPYVRVIGYFCSYCFIIYSDIRSIKYETILELKKHQKA